MMRPYNTKSFELRKNQLDLGQIRMIMRASFRGFVLNKLAEIQIVVNQLLKKLHWCPGGDSNPHAVKHTDLNRACLPIPPPGHILKEPELKVGSLSLPSSKYMVSGKTCHFCISFAFLIRRKSKANHHSPYSLAATLSPVGLVLEGCSEAEGRQDPPSLIAMARHGRAVLQNRNNRK